ncbi:hypothetical protein [Methanolapillus millepedarum]|uniref:FeoB-associated Cys-rich membrane protein n=1 Tax=Methanolapillus millepedarum TaxID=3028296 RepID=A0AA96ZW14_9EURY|nr:hypothetical protein MsAc7_09840 [Methanosarcinaceae archaeon Ac7]
MKKILKLAILIMAGIAAFALLKHHMDGGCCCGMCKSGKTEKAGKKSKKEKAE